MRWSDFPNPLCSVAPLRESGTCPRYLDELSLRAAQSLRYRHGRSQDRIAGLAGKLDSLSPLSVLARGYSVTQAADGKVLTDAKQIQIDQPIQTRLARGTLVSRVESIEMPIQADESDSS